MVAVKTGDRVLFWPRGNHIQIARVTTERTSEEITGVFDLMPTPPSGVFGIISEIPGYAWIITAGNRAYLYSGLPGDGLTVAKNAIADLPVNAGCTVKVKCVVK